jgi:hypothetical protein
MQQADSSRSNSTLASRSVITSSCAPTRILYPIDTGETTMASFKTLAAVLLLSLTAATPAFAQAAIQEPGLFSFYYPNLDVLNGGAPTPAARLSPNWPALRGACAAIGGGVTYCGERYGAPDVLSRGHGRRRH